MCVCGASLMQLGPGVVRASPRKLTRPPASSALRLASTLHFLRDVRVSDMCRFWVRYPAAYRERAAEAKAKEARLRALLAEQRRQIQAGQGLRMMPF